MDRSARNWDVLLIGGASGAGKTSVSYRIAQHFGVGICEADDFHAILAAMTTPEQQPILHYWGTHPEAREFPPEWIVEHTISVARVLTPALEVVIANHLESRTPLVLEGDFLLPSLVSMDKRVRAIFLYEDDEAQIARNFLAREPEEGDQSKRARVSWLFGNWLNSEAEKFGAAVVPARPWNTLFERVLEAIG